MRVKLYKGLPSGVFKDIISLYPYLRDEFGYVKGQYLISSNNHSYLIFGLIVNQKVLIGNGSITAIEVDQDTLCKYTGEIDVNSTEIFEKDILKSVNIHSNECGKSEISVVFFNKDDKPILLHEDGKVEVMEDTSWKFWEVIGTCGTHQGLLPSSKEFLERLKEFL